MRKKRILLTRICAALFCLSILAWAGGMVPAAASQGSTPTVIYQDSFDYTCWNNPFFTAGSVWSREMPQLGTNAFSPARLPS